MARLGSGFLKIAKKVAMFGAAITALALVTIAVLVKKGLTAVDSIGKLARAVGTSTEAIITMQHAAQIGGVDVEKMNKSIAKMTKNVGEAAMGVSEITEELMALGLSAQKLEKMDADEMFGAIADAMSVLPTQARRASVAYKIFGRAGIELNDVLKGGSTAMRGFRKELRDMGVLFSGRQARLVEEANDRWQDLKTLWKGLSDHLAIQMAPLLAAVANNLMDFTRQAGGMGMVAASIFRTVFMGGAGMLDMIQSIQRAWLSTASSIMQVTGELMTYWGKAFKNQEWLKSGADALETARQNALKLLELEWNMPKVDQMIKDLLDAIDKEELTLKLGAQLGGSLGIGGATNTLQTAIGGMKVGADSTAQTSKQILQEAKKENSTSKKILSAIKSGGAVLV
jgi:hypothetical protein